MKFLRWVFILFVCIVLAAPAAAMAQEAEQPPLPAEIEIDAQATGSTQVVGEPSVDVPPASYEIGTVTKILNQTRIPSEGEDFYTQEVEIKRANGQTVALEIGSTFRPLSASQRLEPGMQVILMLQSNTLLRADGSEAIDVQPVIVDVLRLPMLAWLSLGFVVLVAVIAQLRGLLSVVGMVLSVGVLVGGMVPAMMAGYSPLLVSIGGSAVIAALTIYLSHGWNWKSHVALVSLISTLILVTILSYISVHGANLVGLGSEEAAFLQFGATAGLNIQGLFLGGIILGAMGVLDDIVVSQVSVVQQIKNANKKLEDMDVYSRSLEVGKDHIASLVNTLVLAYAGANLPLFLLFYLDSQTPLWVVLNNQLIAEEIVRTLAGSIGLVLAVPITTFIAVRLLKPSDSPVGHRHVH